MKAVTKAMPTTGPATTPAIQVCPSDDDAAAGVCPGGSGELELEIELELEEAALTEVVPRLVDEERADVEPTDEFSLTTQARQTIDLLLDGIAVVLKVSTRQLIWKPGDEICCAYGSAESRYVKRKTQNAFDEKERAWTKVELAPISGGAKGTFGSWGATLVDSLDTLWIMDLKEEFAEAIDAAIRIDFGPKTDGEINVFETIIRYLGGFLGARYLAYAAFDTPNRVPVSRWSPKKAVVGEEQLPAESMLIAEAASASVEITRLSQLTGDMRYFDAISRVTNVLDEQQALTKLPGMWPISVNMRKPDLTFDGFFGLGAMADSVYEYLPKMHQLLNGLGPAAKYQKMYEYAMSTAITHTMFRPMTHDKADILIASGNINGEKESKGQHLVCFAGGMFALGGRLFENTTHIDIGRKTLEGCAWTYKNAPNGIMPEVFSMTACPTLSACEYTAQPGSSPFSDVGDGRYVLRPEAIESIFYMYRITGDTKYQDIACEVWEAISKHTQTDFGNAAIGNVMETPVQIYDSMESF
ncbi:hypothetical protein E8E11_003726 [Didymella keratinophila]|nr:hypothetical protein E8E11_003726 [Didymella keratinophila]